jgi:hypothetical protein
LHNQFALSHNAKGYGSVREGRYQISEIPKVRGVDVVCNGGTNKSLFESRDPMKTKKFKNVLESALQSTRDRFKPLLELYEEMGEMPAGDVAPPPADMPADDKPATDYMAHLGELVKAIVMNEELTPELKTEKIMAAIKVMEETKDEPTEAGAAEEVAEGDEEPGKKEGEEDEAKMESRERANAAKEKLIGVRDLCESLEFHETPIERKMLAALSTAEQKEWIKAQKAARGPGKKITVPRTATGARDVQESRAAGAVGNNFNDTSEEARAARVRDWKH